MTTYTSRERQTAATFRITTDIVVAITDAEALTAAALRRFDDTAPVTGPTRAQIERDPMQALLFLLDPTHGLNSVPGVAAASPGAVVAPPALRL